MLARKTETHPMAIPYSDPDCDDKALKHKRDDLGSLSCLVLVLPRIHGEMPDEVADRAEPEQMLPRRAVRGRHKEF